MNQTSKVISVVALIIVIVAGVWIYRIIYPPEPPQVEITNQGLEVVKKENADMKRRIDELEKQVRQERSRLKCKSVKRLMSLLLMLSLILLFQSYAYSSEAIKFDYVPQGYVSPAEGYWLDVPTGRNLLHMIRTYRERAEYWEREHGALFAV